MFLGGLQRLNKLEPIILKDPILLINPLESSFYEILPSPLQVDHTFLEVPLNPLPFIFHSILSLAFDLLTEFLLFQKFALQVLNSFLELRDHSIFEFLVVKLSLLKVERGF